MIDLWSIPATLVVVVLLLRLMLVIGRGIHQHQGYALLLAGNFALASYVLFGHTARDDGRPTIELLISMAACTLLVGVPWLLARRIRKAFAEDRLDRAARLAGWKELFEPGQASAAERELYEQMALARGGRVDEAISSLRRRLVDAEPPEDEAIQERITTLLVTARRYREAIIQFDTHLADDPARFPGLAIQMVRAFGEAGELERAAELVQRLEETMSPQDATGQAVLLQARLHLLASAGAERAVTRILALDGLKRMPPRMREAFLASVREHAQRRAAEDHDAQSAQQNGSNVQLAAAQGDRNVYTTDHASVVAADSTAEDLARFLEGVAERAAIDVRTAATPARPLPPVTLGLVAANVAAWILFNVFLGDTVNGEHLVRGGASFHPAIRAGEWWRLWTAMFLHDGGLHLFFNLYGLFLLGRLVEPAVGRARFLLIFCAAGLAGNLASVYNPNPAAVFSLGASGGVLGVMGALMVALLLRRGAYPERLRRGLLLNLAVLLAVEIAIGFGTPVVDNFAHVGGLVVGGAAAWLLAPGGLLGHGRGGHAVVVALLAALGLSAALSVRSLVREDPAATIAKLPLRPVRLGPISMDLPDGSRLVEEPGDDPALFDYAAGLQIEPSLILSRDGAEGVLAEAEKQDAAELRKASEEHKLGITIEGAAAPKMVGWSEAAQQATGKLLVLYCARPVDAAHPQQILLVRFIRRGTSPLAPWSEREIRRALGSTKIAPEALTNPTATPPAPTAPAPAPAK